MAKKKRKSRFGANVTHDVERRKKAASSYGYLNLPEGLQMYKEKEGRHKFDVIPYMVSVDNHPDKDPDRPDTAHEGNPWYKRPIYIHRNVGVENDTVVCPKTVGKKCPICEERQDQFAQGMDSKEVVPKPQLRNLYLLIPIADEDYDEELHLWDISNGNFQAELDDELAENPENGRFPDPEDGLTLSIRFSEETFNKNKYYKASRIDFKERKQQYDPEIMEEAPNLDEIFTVLSYKEIQAKFLEIDEEDLDDDSESEEEFDKEEVDTPKKRKRKSFKKKPDPVDEEPEEEEAEEPFEPDEEEDEAEEEDKPIRRKRNKRKKKDANNKCPFGHKFGEDWDEYDDCDDCEKKHNETFEECAEANAELE